MGTSALPLLPSLLPTLHTAKHDSRSPAPQLQPWVSWGTYTIQGSALLLALTDTALALGPHFSLYAGALVDLMGQVIWPWNRDLLEPSLELYGPWPRLPGRRRL